MSPLRAHLADYLSVRRALGYRLDRQEQLLGKFLDELDAHGVGLITTTAALAWATKYRWRCTRTPNGCARSGGSPSI
jgi:hypothetical protein